ncbi:MAG: TIGR03621 family F420-dependent LLM class oxidoreductase, partial [Acidimicrobiales bacterium]|nr:TIGR03621 family F420-dependent LLM class oxidoreductase [Acidimicrobiales bacterium]
MSKPFKFGVMCSTGESAASVRENARKLESLGYYSILYNDHYAGPGRVMEESNHPPQPVASIPAVVVAAEATSTLRVGFRVIAVDYHNPVVLAKELATMDVFSGGRLEIGLGAGWIVKEYEGMGIPFDSAGERISRLEETIQLVRACMGDGPVEFHGSHGVTASGFEATPKPLQRPCPPISVGGGGPKVLAMAARNADIVCFNLNNRAGKISPDGTQASTAGETDKKIAWIKEAAGPRWADLELEIGAYYTAVVDDAKAAAEAFTGYFGLTSD